MPHRTRTPDYSAHKRQIVLSLTREAATSHSWRTLSADAKVVYIIGALVADHRGTVTERDLTAASLKPQAIEYALGILLEAGAL